MLLIRNLKFWGFGWILGWNRLFFGFGNGFISVFFLEDEGRWKGDLDVFGDWWRNCVDLIGNLMVWEWWSDGDGSFYLNLEIMVNSNRLIGCFNLISFRLRFGIHRLCIAWEFFLQIKKIYLRYWEIRFDFFNLKSWKFYTFNK